MSATATALSEMAKGTLIDMYIALMDMCRKHTIDYHRHLSKMELELERVSNELRNKTVSEIVTRLINEELVSALELARCQRDLWRDAYEAMGGSELDAPPELPKTLLEVDVYVTGEVTS